MTPQKDMSKNLCILPWIHLSITPGGFVRLCCQAEEDVALNDVPLSLYTHTIEEIWNSDYMRDVRRDMVEGRCVSACRGCTQSEKLGTGSYRTLSNRQWSEELGPFDDMLLSSQQKGFKVSGNPVSFHLVTGNLCNLKCRMCNPLFSSQVAKDIVQRQWCTPAESSEPKPVKWDVGRNVIGPAEMLGVTAEGFYEPDLVDDRVLRWTGEHASLTFLVPEHLEAESFVLQLAACYPITRKLKVFVNEQLFFDRRLIVYQVQCNRKFSKGPVEVKFDLPMQISPGAVTVRLESETFCSSYDQRNLGVALENIEVWCRPSGKKQKGNPIEHFLPAEPWYLQNDWIVNELFKNPEQLKGLHLSGGEPMVQKHVEDILDFCIDRGVAQNIYLQFNLNCTVLPERIVTKFSSFRRLFLALSIDGYGPWWEYIRYPGKWTVTKKNIERLVQLPNARIMLVPVLMTYNVLNILELFKYAEDRGLECLMYPLSTPRQLDVRILPDRIRKVAAGKFRDFAGRKCSKLTHDHLMQMADYLETVEDKCSEESLLAFMLFTNDLDAERGQDFRKLHGELLGLLEESGVHWNNEKHYAG